MKQIIRKILFILGIFWVSPLLIPFWLTTEKKLILADASKWIECLDREKTDDIKQLLILLKEIKEYRNLYYFRLFQGNFAGRLAMYIFKFIYREFPYLFLDYSSTIGPGLFIQHGFSTMIMADLGENCWVNQQVTIGHKDKTGRPKIGNHVKITAGAKVLGNIKIGDDVTVGANAVVVKDVPDRCVVVGIPAYIIKRDGVKVEEKL
jgi:serine O-acetyltransferase